MSPSGHGKATPQLKLVAELRKLTRVSVSIAKARETLAASNNDVSATLVLLQKDLTVSGAQKAANVADRAASESLVGTDSEKGHLGVLSALVEFNCETDFVARNAFFSRLVADIALTAEFCVGPAKPETYSDSGGGSSIRLPRTVTVAVLSHATVANAIRAAIAKLGENIVLQRAAVVALPHAWSQQGLRVTARAHGHGVSMHALLRTPDFRGGLERIDGALARQIEEEGALCGQPFMVLGDALEGETVEAGLGWWRERSVCGIQVVEFLKWTVGESTNAT
ncbi:hypothetical protein EI94DRAFT_1774371 [Lactarius quietus]|nr:hypothetical protein EI94DRAFT_1774371 [Lactarius quietus]